MAAELTSNQQKHSADSARQVVLSRQLAAQSSALIDTNSDLASLLAVQAYRTSATSQAIESLYAAAAVPLKHRPTGQRGAVSSVAFSPDGGTLATGSTSDDQLWLWDTRTGRLGRTFNGQSEATALVAVSPDGQTLTTMRQLRTRGRPVERDHWTRSHESAGVSGSR